ncbi:hypothetical protein G7Y82_04875 [Solimonas sp. C16B3]|uniref:Outer membrane protein beta-barrel domain-containing protein n=2 Tax=Solimonas marina TaxID=2714601 RepID=A0A969W8T4_9GAMM|nr:hypothetical protein [Solimonas marina]
MKMRHVLLAACLLVPATSAFADDLDINCQGGLLADDSCQQAFHGAAKDVAATLNYKIVAPAESTGILGFGIAAIASYTPTQHKDDWNTLTGDDVKQLGMVGAVINKGLPLGFDVGAFYATVPTGDGAAAYGFQLRYAILDGGIAEPALAVEANYTIGTGIDDFDYHSWGVDAMLSKGFAFLTPYIGVGYASAQIDPSDSVKAEYALKDESVDTTRFFVGSRIALGFFELTPEYEHFGKNNVYNLRLGFSF